MVGFRSGAGGPALSGAVRPSAVRRLALWPASLKPAGQIAADWATNGGPSKPTEIRGAQLANPILTSLFRLFGEGHVWPKQWSAAPNLVFLLLSSCRTAVGPRAAVSEWCNIACRAGLRCNLSQLNTIIVKQIEALSRAPHNFAFASPTYKIRKGSNPFGLVVIPLGLVEPIVHAFLGIGE